ncbi:uncharacterized protein VTP21DRAFT_8400 [Calcarisporiella thermophila]|uniref:uncharacterized protein n=1 Tax=Calcarisporiella thermophila TaxID=911321 RepID=UPI00374381FF
MSSSSYDEFPVVIGIDFGTTYSGCSYAFVQNKEVVDIQRWPRQGGDPYPKVPSQSIYPHGSKQLQSWGHGARHIMSTPDGKNMLMLRKFKLYLDENLHLPPLPNHLSVVDVISDYLGAFHSYVLGELRKSFGAYDNKHFRYCLTVPAMWSDRAKAAMRLAAIRAGLVGPHDHPDRLLLISEPEAAALYCEKKCEQFNLQPGNRFMICDAGGGTVDLVVFEIEEQFGVRSLKEITKGHGSSCGSTFLDENMRRLLESKLARLGRLPTMVFEQLMQRFVDDVKPNFDGQSDHFIHLPAGIMLQDGESYADIGIEDNMLRLTAQELKMAVFDPVINSVLGLIDEQLRQAKWLDAIFLVGGFGQSDYLHECVKHTFVSTGRVGLVGVPPRGALAVVRGAVMFGLYPRVIAQRIARRSYGVETTMRFEPGLDPAEYSFIRADGNRYCRYRFSIYCYKGQPVRVDECVTKTYSVTYPNDTDCDLFACDLDGPTPRLTTHPAIRKVAAFPIKMPNFPDLKHGDRVQMTVKMFFGLTELKINVRIRDREFIFTSTFENEDPNPQAYSASPPPYSS